jgi:long-chain acyl-CoA synthetase
MGRTIPSFLLSSIEKFKVNIAFNYFDGLWKSITYKDFFELSQNLASLLLNNKIVKGDKVSIVSENRPEWCSSYLGIVMIGAVAVPIDSQLGFEEIRNLLIDSESKVVFYTNKTEEKVLEAIYGSNIIGINLDNISFIAKPQFYDIEIRNDDIASIIYTSGTTGKPKGVLLSHENFCSDAEAIIESGIVNGKDNVLSVLPLHHTYPFMCTFLVPLLLGATITFASGLKATDIFSAIKEKNVTICVLVPKILELIRNRIFSKIKEKKVISKIMLAVIRVSGFIRSTSNVNLGKFLFFFIHRNFGRVRLFVSGGARLEPSVMYDLESIGFTIIEGYGLTETSPVVTFNPIKKRKIGSVGKALPNVEIKIGEDSEIIVKGPIVMKGYYKNPEATAEVLKDGWLFTGDTGYMDEEGYLYVTGRKKELIILSSGKNIYPEDVEGLYEEIPLIKEICVLEKDDSLHAVIVPDFEYAKKERIANINEALKWSINTLSFKIPEYMRIKGFTLYPDPLPKTSLGKLRRFMVKEILYKKIHEPKVIKEETVEDDFSKKVIECIRMQMKEKIPVRLTDHLELDLGFDSLMKIELISDLETNFSISLPDTFVVELQTVQDVISKMKEYSGIIMPAREKISLSDILKKEPAKGDKEKVLFKYKWWQKLIAYLLFLIQKAFFKLIYRLKVIGDLNIPDKGPFIMAANHTSFLDGFVLAASLPFDILKDLYFLGYQKYFTGRLTSAFARIAHVIPIDPDVYLNRALQISAYILREGKCLCIFPEGGRSFDGTLMPFKKGIGVLALELNMPVVPVLIKGTFEALPRGAKFLRMSKIRVSFGKPLYPSDITFENKPEAVDKYQFFADELRKRFIKEWNL